MSTTKGNLLRALWQLRVPDVPRLAEQLGERNPKFHCRWELPHVIFQGSPTPMWSGDWARERPPLQEPVPRTWAAVFAPLW